MFDITIFPANEPKLKSQLTTRIKNDCTLVYIKGVLEYAIHSLLFYYAN